MKLRKIALTNVGCFLDRQELLLDEEMAILIGPNGGGKTTLLDTAIRTLRRYFLIARFPQEVGSADAPAFTQWENENSVMQFTPNKHWQGAHLPQKIELDLQVTASDVQNIVTIQRDLPEYQRRSPQDMHQNPLGAYQEWNADRLQPGAIFHYELINGTFNALTPEAQQFLSYLNSLDVHRQIRHSYNFPPLALPIAYFPVVRQQGFSTAAQLANTTLSQARRASEQSHSKGSNAGLVELAIQMLAEKANYLVHNTRRDALASIRQDPGPKLLTETLRKFGYTWDFKCENIRTNLWRLMFQRSGANFSIDNASSGEREILYYAVSITLLEIRDTVVVIDEPELHLHPRSQRQLLSLFEHLAKSTNNQFVFATHSPLFVTPQSIRHVTRVASVNGSSKINQLDSSGIPGGKHALDLVNALNNEKIFFADKVILVEGSSDEIIFGELFKQLGLLDGRDIEIVRVGGKGSFLIYQALLSACKLPHAVIADRDYLREIGSEEVKRLFAINAAEIKRAIDNADAYTDGRALIEAIGRAIETKNTAELEGAWKYVSARRTALQLPLSSEAQATVDQLILHLRAQSIFVLKNGEIEDYLPEGYRRKDLNKSIELINRPDFMSSLPEPGRSEISEICRLAAQP